MIRKWFCVLSLSIFCVSNVLNAQTVAPSSTARALKTTREDLSTRRKMLEYHQLSGFITLLVITF
ncbi:hypothetical protein [Leptospira alstonii]|uniref:Uncharacterized protein n=2 Tax=Leptospira alstonii TaxID=28452 RepID=M6D0W6_9LEPT|nr:hypothetical protein [Leptospira alstonii]EMJ97594.1 hypothetical protein LEP1GSC194_2986 [Leptospira alstonii serovar Sichuan str. 79601]EQA79334.1 hypothetical protein LEP1GSC193_3206 [Leptospira alstonii serovar Pingchang str. 80-412]